MCDGNVVASSVLVVLVVRVVLVALVVLVGQEGRDWVRSFFGGGGGRRARALLVGLLLGVVRWTNVLFSEQEGCMDGRTVGRNGKTVGEREQRLRGWRRGRVLIIPETARESEW